MRGAGTGNGEKSKDWGYILEVTMQSLEYLAQTLVNSSRSLHGGWRFGSCDSPLPNSLPQIIPCKDPDI